MKASISYYPNLTKKSKRTNKTPIYIRICMHRKKAEERLNIELTENEIQKWNAMTMRINDRSSYANSVLNSLDQKFQQFMILNSDNLSEQTARKLLDYVMGNDKTKPVEALEFAEKFFDSAIKANGTISIGTVKNYRKALNHLTAYLKYKRLEALTVPWLDQSFAIEFKEYLITSIPLIRKKAMTETSASNIIKKFRTIYDRAVDKGLLEKNPFKIVKLKTRSPRRARLNMEQVKAIYDLDCTGLPIQSIYRDLFLFSVFTGLAYVDAHNLKEEHLHFRADGEVKLSLDRNKTGVHTECFLVSFAKDLLRKYQGSPEHQITSFILPHRSNKELNVQLKIIAGICNNPIKLTSHIARHTFRQLLSEAGIQDLGVIKRMMGQSRGNDIDDVYYSITESRLLEAKRKFEVYLKKNLVNDNRSDRRKQKAV